MEITLKMHKFSALFDCACYMLVMFLISAFLFFGTLYWILMFCVFILMVLFFMMYTTLKKFKKGYVAILNSKGVTLPNNRFVAWHAIEAIIEMHPRYKPHSLLIYVKHQPAKNILVKMLNKMRNVIMLDNFEIGVQEAYKLLMVCWTQYR